MAVITYFLNKDLKNRSLFIGIRRVRDSYNGENITKAIILIILEIRIISNLGYFITDNATNNNIVIKVVLRRLHPNIIHPGHRKVRYLSYIINLAAKTFLFNSEKESFEDIKTNNLVFITALEAEIVF
jgi:hypothetical protein